MKEIAKQGQFAKSILGGSLEDKQHVDNGMPGPGAYQVHPLHSIPGFTFADLDKKTVARTTDTDIKKRQRTLDVGPLSYSPMNPSWSRTDNLKDGKHSIGNAVR